MKYTALAASAMLAMSSASFAGFTNHYQVNIVGNTAYGSFIGARQSADATQYIYCASVNFTTSSPYVVCGARTAAGAVKSCTSTDPGHMEAVRGLSNESYVYMRWDDSGRCDYIYTSTGSMYHQ
ncbi:hypothetical protein [Permianibacter aggregans]|uniref:Uncharacterized protein n=1 Tax=Permianibacter aggregans TaxID=1510150 RepID=A0A4R6UR44_9GAMM|nr:hypothetical protein [Permianibacter aggregans]QGX40984.1 hypothetical protein E2H98_15450 [Permianibacter aggregans]TDQ48043.1 hypothetical protein EV696_10823 [Permianibacter aggregans]